MFVYDREQMWNLKDTISDIELLSDIVRKGNSKSKKRWYGKPKGPNAIVKDHTNIASHDVNDNIHGFSTSFSRLQLSDNKENCNPVSLQSSWRIGRPVASKPKPLPVYSACGLLRQLVKPVYSLRDKTVWDILGWNPAWIKQFDSAFPKCLPPLLSDIDMAFVNENWKQLDQFDDYPTYRDRFRKLHLLELWQQVYSGFESGNSLEQFICSVSVPIDPTNYTVYAIERAQEYGKCLQMEPEDLMVVNCGGLDMFAVVQQTTYMDADTSKPIYVDRDAPPKDDQVLIEQYKILVRASYRLHKTVRIRLITKLCPMLRLLDGLDRSETAELLAMLLKPYTVQPRIVDEPLHTKIRLNDSQKNVVLSLSQLVLDTNDRSAVAMVHGPPGSGKSHTIMALALEIYLKFSQRRQGRRAILVCGPSNGAVDAIARKFINHIRNSPDYDDLEMVRIGGKMMAKDVKHISVNDRAKPEFEHRKSNGERVTIRKVKNWIMCKADIIFGTLNSFGGADAGCITNPLCVIIDEACQANELETLMPLQFAGTTRLILIGDHKQLPPTILNQEAQRLHFNRSLFERLRPTLAKEVLMLDTQYRMVPHIAAFPARHIYDNKLLTPAAHHSTCPRVPANFGLCSYLVIDTHLDAGEEIRKDDTQSLYNTQEALIVKRVCMAVLQRTKTGQRNIGVISFYKSQVDFITNNLKLNGLGDVEVNTVDGFQGREKDVIVLSTVRVGNSLGFVNDRRRMNVAITRAKYGMYVVGNAATLQRNSDWCALINDAETRNCMIRLEKGMNVQRQVQNFRRD